MCGLAREILLIRVEKSCKNFVLANLDNCCFILRISQKEMFSYKNRFRIGNKLITIVLTFEADS